METSLESVVNGFYAAWILRDVPALLAYLSDDVKLTQHFEDPALPFAGATVGKRALKARIEMIFNDWVFDHAKPINIPVDHETMRTRCPCVIRHIATGQSFDGSLRHVWVVREGRIVQIDEYLDISRLKAFLRLLGGPDTGEP